MQSFMQSIINLFTTNKKIDSTTVYHVELIIEISFETFGQVYFTDENYRPWIKEFTGIRWTTIIQTNQVNKIKFRAFINNLYLQKEQTVTLIKKVNNEIEKQKLFKLTGEIVYEGWFDLGL